jgi:hypothetical protein
MRLLAKDFASSVTSCLGICHPPKKLAFYLRPNLEASSSIYFTNVRVHVDEVHVLNFLSTGKQSEGLCVAEQQER